MVILRSPLEYRQTTLKNMDRKKILHYRQFYEDLNDPIVFISVSMNSEHLKVPSDYFEKYGQEENTPLPSSFMRI
jgi:hypothetical protein